MFEGNDRVIMFVIKYKHDYYKQSEPLHTTIRGLSYIKANRLNHGDTVREEYPSRVNICKVLKIYPREIKDLSLEFLKADCEYKGFTISSHEDFCKLLNTFIPSFYQQATPESFKVVVELKILIHKS